VPDTRLSLKFNGWIVTVFLFLLQSCSTHQVSLPALSEGASGQHFNGRVIWHDLLTDEIQASKQFYGELFGWEFKTLPLFNGKHGEYTLILSQGQAIAGMVDTSQLRRDVDLSQWVSVFSSSDIQAAVTRVEQSGGTVFTAPVSVGQRGTIAVAADAQGALFAMLETPAGDPAEAKASIGTFLWDELWTDNPEQATAFYRALFDYSLERTTLTNGEVYQYFSAQEKPRAAVIENPVAGLSPTWVSFIRVENPEVIVSRVEALGGEVLLDVRENPVGGKLAILRDPAGAGFLIQTWDQ